MPSSIGHALVAAAIGAPLAPRSATWRYWLAGVFCAIVPDVDAVGRPFGAGDIGFLGGHRALTHSIVFSLALAVTVLALTFRGARWDGLRGRVVSFLILATAAHGLLDTFTVYGGGVALLYPFSDVRYRAPWLPLRELNEVVWVWLPAIAITLVVWGVRAHGSRSEPRAAA